MEKNKIKQNKSIQSSANRTSRTGPGVRAKSKLTQSITQTVEITIQATRCEIIQADSTGRRSVATIGANGAALSTSCRQVRASAKVNGSPSLAEINAAYQVFEPFIAHEPTQKISSYVLKHLLEKHLAKLGIVTYFSNGSAIAASAMAGFVQDFSPDSINSTVRCPVALLRELGERTQRKPAGVLPVVTLDHASQLRTAASEV